MRDSTLTADELKGAKEARLETLRRMEDSNFQTMRKAAEDLALNYAEHAKFEDITNPRGRTLREQAVKYMTLAQRPLKAADLVKEYTDEALAAEIDPHWAFNLNATKNGLIHVLD